MTSRLFVVAIVLTAALAGLAASRLIDRGDGAPQRDPSAPGRSTTASRVAALESRVREQPDDVQSLAELAALLVARARETGDPAFYASARVAAERALAISPDDPAALVAAGGVALGQHDFERALTLGERARAVAPDLAAVYGVLTDAYVELGRYDEALTVAQEMLDRRPGFASYTRASYLRELHGDIDGAIELMQQAARAGTGVPSDAAWAELLTGNLYLTAGDLDAAGRHYDAAARMTPDDAAVLAARARLAIALGDEATGERLLRAALAARPLAEYAIALGELLESQGHADEAGRQYAVVRAARQLLDASGVAGDVELALFEADHGGNPGAAYEAARATYERQPSIYAADALAWAAYHAGRLDEARRYSAEALRLGTRDPLLAYHAGVIATSAGDSAAGEQHLRDAVATGARLSPLQAQAARAALETFTARTQGGAP